MEFIFLSFFIFKSLLFTHQKSETLLTVCDFQKEIQGKKTMGWTVDLGVKKSIESL